MSAPPARWFDGGVLRLAYRGQGRLEVERAEAAPLAAGHVRVRVHSTGICTSDVYGYSGLNQRRDAVLGPGDVLVMGHECAGTVVELGDGAGGPPPGTLVAVNPIVGCGACGACRSGEDNLCADRSVHGCVPSRPGAYADHVDVPAPNAVPLAGAAPAEWGALVEPIAVGAHGVRLAGVAEGDDVLVIGGGIVGLGAGLCADRRGGRVTLVEPQASRRAVAEALGLAAVAPGDAAADAVFDAAIDCVARPETLAAAMRALPSGGTVVVVGIYSDEIPFSISELVGRELRVAGSYGYSPADFAEVAGWVGRGERDLSPVIQARVGFDGLVEAFERYADGSSTPMRTLLQPAGATA